MSTNRYPKCLDPGDTIGVIAPSSPEQSSSLDDAVSMLENRGYRVLLGKHYNAVHNPLSYLAGCDNEKTCIHYGRMIQLKQSFACAAAMEH